MTDDGHMIYDVTFKGEALAKDMVAKTDAALHSIPGLVETGLFVGMCQIAYIGNKDGTVSTLTSKTESAAASSSSSSSS